VSSSDHEVVLERTDSISFCVNALLCILTARLWAIAWTRRNRTRRAERKVLPRAGSVPIARTIELRGTP
jgi:uncharacterized membrane protein YidH (DUF202 family)